MKQITLALGNVETLDAEDRGGAALADLLGVAAPRSWPPEGNDADTRDWMRGLLSAHPDEAKFVCHYIIANDRLVGTCGFTGPPDGTGRVELGYGVIAQEQRRGYASAAVARLLEIAFNDPRVTVVAAETLAESVASQKVLSNCAFTRAGTRSDEAAGDIRMFVRRR